ncbi:hypothetical protein [Kribbella sp. CA-247076]|uniref:hypothetical protein n=1 Tax=Kribbella sp. CA-247076 TaxID=3239941 RepID=UPI003D8BA00D
MSSSATPTRRRRRLPMVVGGLAAAGVLAGVLMLAPSAGANSSEEAQANDPSSSVSSAKPGGPGSLIYTGGAYSVQLSVSNNTGQTMTWYGGNLSNGHWNERPTGTITDQTADTMTAYTDQLGGFTWNLMWKLDNGEFACVSLSSGELTNDQPHNISGYIAKNLDEFGNCGDVDPAYGGSTSNSGGAHSWVDLDFNTDGD